MEVGQPDNRAEARSAVPIVSRVAGGEGSGTYGGQQDGVYTETERSLVRKLDRRVIPLLASLYLLSVLDRSNIGNARIAGMSTSLHLTGTRYEWLLTAFYIAYIVFEWFALMWKIIPAHVWAACTVLAWGLVATLQSTTTTFAGEMACRFLLGMAEAGFAPGVPFLLSFFYLRRELGFRIGLFLAAAPLANSFSGGLAYGITSGHSKLSSWRILFLAEGLPTIFMAPVAFFFLPDSPEEAKFLTAEEKAVVRTRKVRQVGGGDRIGSIDWKHVGGALCDIKNWLTAFMYFSCNVSFSSLPVFLPTILKEMGFTAIHAQGLTAPPYLLSFLVVIVTTWVADRTQQRGLTIMTLSIIGGTGYLLLATTELLGPRYLGVCLAAAGIFPAIANILPWVLNNQGSDTKRGTGIAILNMIGQCGTLLGTRIYPVKDGPRYQKGHFLCAGFMFFTTLLALGLRTMLNRGNKILDRRYSTTEAQVPAIEAGRTEQEKMRGKGKAAGLENEGPAFRYVL